MMTQDAGPCAPASLTAIAVGALVLDSIMGDLTGMGRDDALLVIEPTPAAPPGTRQTLEVALMQRDAAGRLRKVATNVRLLTRRPHGPAHGCLRAEPGAFTVVDPGGDGEAAAEYRFVYDKRGREWIAASVLRRVADPVTGRIDRKELTAGDFGRITFELFDPGWLPAP